MMQDTHINLLTVSDLARRIGYAESYIRKLVQRGEIPFLKLSRKALRFDPTEIERWIAERNAAEKAKSEDKAEVA